MAEKVTWMVLKVDLKCPSCHKKVKKILCKFPEIRDQVYDEEKNLVKITVVCCSPERVRDKLRCNGRNVIKSIEILDPPKPGVANPKNPADPPKTPSPATAPAATPTVTKPTPQVEPDPAPVAVFPPPEAALGIPVPTKPYPFPFGFGCPQCFQGYGEGLCYHGCWRHVPPPPNYDINYYGYGYDCHYFSEEEPSGCTLM